MGEHTPGPWRVGFEDGTGGVEKESGAWIIGVEDEIVVAGGNHDGLKYGVPDEDNAKLIAAAPELLEAAKRAYAYFQIQAEKKRAEETDDPERTPEQFLEPEGMLLREVIFKASGEI